MTSKFTLKEALDYLEELIDVEESVLNVDALYIEPPENEQYDSGEDDTADDDVVGVPSGYMVNFEIYQGKGAVPNGEYDRFGKCAAPLLCMIDDFLPEIQALPFHFYFDNLFTGFPLLTHMKSRG